MPDLRLNRSTALLSFCVLAVLVYAVGCNSAPVGATTGGSSGSTELNLVAQLGTDSARAVVRFEQQSGGEMFDVNVTGGQPGATIRISIGGTEVATITLDSTGNGQLHFSSTPNGADEQPFPNGFQFPNAGEAVVVGEWNGQLEDDSTDPSSQDGGTLNDQVGDSGAAGDQADAGKIEYCTSFGSGEGGFHANMKYEEYAGEKQFYFEVFGGRPNTSVEVSVGEILVGTIALDASGAGKLIFTSNPQAAGETMFPGGFPEIADDTPISIRT